MKILCAFVAIIVTLFALTYGSKVFTQKQLDKAVVFSLSAKSIAEIQMELGEPVYSTIYKNYDKEWFEELWNLEVADTEEIYAFQAPLTWYGFFIIVVTDSSGNILRAFAINT